MMERRGFAFNREEAQRLYAELVKRRLEIGKSLKETFPPPSSKRRSSPR
jgi:hypothetical protein